MADAKNHFIKFSKPPFSKQYVSHIFPLNQTELLVIIYNNKWNWQLQETWIYNICNDNYTTFIPEESVNEYVRWYTASLNDTKSFLYLFGYSGKIIKLNLKTKQFESSNKSYH
eukprot:319193_1